MEPRIVQSARQQPAPDLVIPPRPPLPTAVAPRSTPTPAAPHTTRRLARTVLVVYAVALTLIAIWPVPVDSGAGPVLRKIAHIFPIATHARIEFGANILLFVPLGALLALILTHRHLVLPIALVTTVTIESMQALMLERRVPSMMDIVANVTGACIGLLVVAALEWWRRRRDEREAA